MMGPQITADRFDYLTPGIDRPVRSIVGRKAVWFEQDPSPWGKRKWFQSREDLVDYGEEKGGIIIGTTP
jgi:hypothetical protein